MKALSLTQPWASLVAQGRKQIETRSWSTGWRGQVAIHASKGWRPEDRAYTLTLIRRGELEAELRSCWPALPLGYVVATATIADVIPTDDVVIDLLYGGKWVVGGGGLLHIDGVENSYGDYTAGRYAWLLIGIKRLLEPIPARGSLGLWEWTP